MRFISLAMILGAWLQILPLRAEEVGNRFTFAQLKTRGTLDQWDPYPLAAQDILGFLVQTTSLRCQPERRVLTIQDPALFQCPFLWFSGAGSFSLTSSEREILKRYLLGGGFLVVEDRIGEKGGSFDASFRREIRALFPEKALQILPREHAVYRSYYLLRGVSGRKLTQSYLEGLDVDGRTVLLYSENDIFGAWAKDLLGNYLYACDPGGETQRWEAQKLMVNVILYSVTGTYKTDAIHLPFIENKLRR